MSNKDTVRAFYEMAFNDRKPEEAVQRYLGPYYKQHNPQAADGPEAFIGFVHWFAETFPGLHVDIKRALEDGDLVAVHCHITRGPEDRGMAVMDMFRLEDGKIVEHWDVLQEIPETAANSNTMF